MSPQMSHSPSEEIAFNVEPSRGQLEEVKEVSQPSLEDYIIAKAKEHGVDPETALAVAMCESSLNPKAIGDNGDSLGLWQINSPSWPEVTREQALDGYWATDWAMPKLKATPEIWTCYRMLSTGV